MNVVLLLFLCLSSCVFPKPIPPSFLILVVDSLGFDSISCHRDSPADKKSGLDQFCQGSIRFHHAYTPSVLAQPALASLLTGLYPYEHGLRSNGSDFLSSKFKTLSEEALEKGYRSSFFSGGGAIWRNSGLNQGFEIFDDNVPLSWKKIYRPMEDNIRLFLKWLDQFDRYQPFFSMLYLPDLQFVKIGTVEEKDISKKLDRELYGLIQELKKRKRWHSAYVILVGTRGEERYQSFRQNELPVWSLFSDNTRLSLFIKGLHKLRKKSRYGNVSTPASLVDIGLTIFDLLGQALKGLTPKGVQLLQKKQFPGLSFKSQLINRDLVPDVSSSPVSLDLLNLKKQSPSSFARREIEKVVSTRPLLMEASWPLWQKVGQRRFAIRKGSYLFIHDEEAQLYNSLTDRRELNPFPTVGSHANIKTIKFHFLNHLKSLNLKPWKHPSPSFTEKLRIGKKIFSLSPFQSSIEHQNQLRVLIKKSPQDWYLVSWRAELALKSSQWKVLRTLGKKTSNFYWQFVAHRRLGDSQKPPLPKSDCEKLFVGKKSYKCDNKSLVSLFDWTQNYKDKNKKNQFFYFYLREKTHQTIRHLNQSNYLIWNTHESSFQGPLLSDLFLHLPENKKFLKQVKKSISF